MEGQAEGLDLSRVVGVVGDDGDDLGAELAAAPAPEQVGEAVVFARDHDRDPLALARLGEAVVHLEARRDLLARSAVELSRSPLGNRVEDHPHEEAPLVAGVLVGVDDVEAGLGEEAADRGDQPRPVGAGKQQARCRRLGDRPIIPASRELHQIPSCWAENLTAVRMGREPARCRFILIHGKGFRA